MAKLKKLNPDDIIDTLYIREVSEETGEVVEYSKAVYSAEGQCKMDDNKRIKLSEKELYVYLKEEYGNFFFYFYNVLDGYDIKPQYKVRFLYLASYLDFNNDLLVAKSEYGLKIQLNRQMISDILKLKDAEFRNTLTVLLDCGLLIKDNKHYKLNTSCGIKGDVKGVKGNYTRVFITSIRQLYDKCKPINHKQLYYLFKILPHLNVNLNIPCEDTQTDIVSKVKPFNMKTMCEKLGYDKSSTNKLWNILRGFKIEDDYVVCKHTIDKDEYIAINPRVYYAGTRIENVTYLMNIFDMNK